jgi:hypothetical protein
MIPVMRKRPVCIYVDNSNIYIGGKEVAKHKKEDSSLFRLDFTNFLNLVTEGNKEFDEFVWAGSSLHEMEDVFKGIRNKGIDLHLIPRSESGENETVDEAIQLAMYRHHRKYRSTPGTIILCTGDGKGFHDEKGFLFDVTGFTEDGWKLILYSWDAVCHHGLKQFAKQHGHYLPLEEYYDSVTFIKDKRHAKALTLNNHT